MGVGREGSDAGLAAEEADLLGEGGESFQTDRRASGRLIGGDAHFEEEGHIHREEPLVEGERLYLEMDAADLCAADFDVGCLIDHALAGIGEVDRELPHAVFVAAGVINPPRIDANGLTKDICRSSGKVVIGKCHANPPVR